MTNHPAKIEPIGVLHRAIRTVRMTIALAANWQIRPVAHRDWDNPKIDFRDIAFEESGVWFFPEGGPLIRAPLPRE